jgi:hypothetical protein
MKRSRFSETMILEVLKEAETGVFSVEAQRLGFMTWELRHARHTGRGVALARTLAPTFR